MSPRHSNSDTGWIKREFAKIRKQLREDRAAKRAQALTVGKGGITVKDGGTLTARYPASMGGGRGVWFGPLPKAESDAAPALGLQVTDEDGAYIFQILRQYPSTSFPTGQTAATFTADQIIGVSPATTFYRDDFAAYVSVDPDGVSLNGGSNGVKIAHSTTGASANCFIDPSDQRIWRSSSSRRYKQDIEDATVDTADVLNLQPRTWRDKGQVEADTDTETRYVGFIAEELDELPTMRQFVIYDAEGQPEAIAYDRLSVALLGLAQDHERRLQALEGAEDRQQPHTE